VQEGAVLHDISNTVTLELLKKYGPTKTFNFTRLYGCRNIRMRNVERVGLTQPRLLIFDMH